MIEYAEGELFQILEDDGRLSLEQVSKVLVHHKIFSTLKALSKIQYAVATNLYNFFVFSDINQDHLSFYSNKNCVAVTCK